jgi:hypothetical protein
MTCNDLVWGGMSNLFQFFVGTDIKILKIKDINSHGGTFFNSFFGGGVTYTLH